VSESTQRCGLVIGYVQSGKTSSFEAVTALAKDNGFKLVVVIAGTTEILQTQTRRRFEIDFELGQVGAFHRWSLLNNPAPNEGQGDTLRQTLERHSESSPYDLGIPLVIVMKQHLHLSNLIEVLRGTRGLENIPALIIDDESHMYSPNVGKAERESATYGQLRQLREQLPIHTLLQYTATPQAPLLAELTDELSPEFVRLLEPGHGYTGGEYFFLEHRDDFVNLIPVEETYALDPDEFDEYGAPGSLRSALLTFLVGCAAERLREQREGSDVQISHRAMLVHPKVAKAVHNKWFVSVKRIAESIQQLLSEQPDDPDLIALVKHELQPVWRDLKKTNPSIPPIPELLPEILSVLGVLRYEVVNSTTSDNSIPWGQSRYWVLVGGNLLGVGFTIEGLTVTHMMRPTGTRLMDSIQQRARFFGYKADYASWCRAWIQSELDDAFVDYVRHEQALRQSLKEIDDQNLPLREWKRVFLMDQRFKPTRKAAQRIMLGSLDVSKSDGWCIQRHFSKEDDVLADENRKLLRLFGATRVFRSAPSISGSTPATQHSLSECTLDELQELLAMLRFSGSDSRRFTALGLLISVMRDGGEDAVPCAVVNVASGLLPERRERSITKGIVTVHQGRNPVNTGAPYGGDKFARLDDRITLQLHWLDLKEGGHLLRREVPYIAVYLPNAWRRGLLYEI
jgi:hypothetical protein